MDCDRFESHKPTVLLDMDGVLYPFNELAAPLLGYHLQPFMTDTGGLELDLLPCDNGVITGTRLHWPQGQWNMAEAIGVTIERFWQLVDAHDLFWTKGEPYFYVHDLIAGIEGMGADWMLCSSPPWNPLGSSGKVEWAWKHLGIRPDRVCLTGQKYRLGWPNAILVDDNPATTAEFTKWGGHGVTFPRHWSTGEVPNPADVVLAQIRQLLETRL